MPTAWATPFDDCPAEAFLGQNAIPQLYSVQLATGYYNLLSSDMGTTGKINALGFNHFDNYLYAWSYEHNTLAKIDRDYQLTPLEVENVPDTNFYIGDVAVSQNIYYFYRPGHGLYRIPLDPEHPQYLVSEKVVNASAMSLNIFDMAFHPTNEFAYSVNHKGNLYRFNTNGSVIESLGNVGQSGTFGAVYFDVEENLYISRNNDGHIYRIKIGDENYTAEFFAYGPSSGNNDGARCALAPIASVENPTIDFGDAPASYGTSLDDNGARHDTSNGVLYLGNSVDAEPNASGMDDAGDEGIVFLTGLEVDAPAFVEVTASAPGYLNAWVDFDIDGEFDSDEKIASGYAVSTGTNTLEYAVPSWAASGNTWARFRLSSEDVVGPSGGVDDGEVEDYKVDLTEPNISVRTYPGENQWATLAFEDNWPLMGDYDFNDLVVNYRISEYLKPVPNSSNAEQEISKITIEGRVVAQGAAYHNGFAFHLPGVLRSQVIEAGIRYQINGVTQTTSPLEANRNSAILFIADDLHNFVTPGETCKHYRTEPGCGSDIQMTFSLTVPLVSGITTDNFPAVPYDPFITATEGHERNYVFGLPPGRAYEIHLKNMAPTEAAREDFFTRGDDKSNPNSGEYYLNENGMPWVINIPTQWHHPLEYIDIIYAYPQFGDHANSGGLLNNDWFLQEKATQKNLFTQ
ncbi:LruC domain-containing protein [Marinibactrum halimedae]|uniref:LruC domain-containing protein n=1 Tax=Marinibactrum halimedae TaxID=1444977 RepID=A0AA37T1C3_9GAMM|nr:LruC domain-containing protein [Marinibactrum halimedae]